MREIKFRAWYTPFKNKKFGTGYKYGNSVISFHDMSPDKYELEQYTGLKDKNGVDIYEGDIVKLHIVVLSPDDRVGEIKYSSEYGYSIYFTSNRMARQEDWSKGWGHTIEVIGNIHENADLLEDL